MFCAIPFVSVVMVTRVFMSFVMLLNSLHLDNQAGYCEVGIPRVR